MNAQEVAWAAGFFDGEGSVHAGHKEGKPRKDGTWRTYPRLTISNTNRSLLVRFMVAVGKCGAINGPYPRQGGRTKPIWHWTASHKSARAVAEKLMPLISDEKGIPMRKQYGGKWVDGRTLQGRK